MGLRLSFWIKFSFISIPTAQKFILTCRDSFLLLLLIPWMLLQYGNDSFIWVVFIFILLYLCISTYCNKKQENGDEKGEIVPTWGLFLPASLLENSGVENGVKIKNWGNGESQLIPTPFPSTSQIDVLTAGKKWI